MMFYAIHQHPFSSLYILLNDPSLITDNPETIRCSPLPKAILTSF